MKPVLKLRTFGSPEARFWLVLPVDAKELTAAEEVYTAVVANSTKLVYLLAATRNALLPLLPEDKTLLLGGYSLAGLFALWTGYETDRFAGVAAVSPSVWYPGWLDYIRTRTPKAKRIYLSLGDREELAKNRVLASVGDCIRAQYALLEPNTATLEWNPGNHFRDPWQRTARGFLWLLEQLQ